MKLKLDTYCAYLHTLGFLVNNNDQTKNMYRSINQAQVFTIWTFFCILLLSLVQKSIKYTK